VGRYLDSSWARPISLADAVALVERVHEAAARGARECLAALANAVSAPIGCVAMRSCPTLPTTIEERIRDTRAAHWYDREHVFRDGAKALGGDDLDAFLRAMGRSIGPPWQAKHKLAAAAALGAVARCGR
jgi:hypothetical protein